MSRHSEIAAQVGIEMGAHPAVAKAYADGYEDGIKEMIDQMRNRSEVLPEGGYKGPIHPELDTYLAALEKRVSEQ